MVSSICWVLRQPIVSFQSIVKNRLFRCSSGSVTNKLFRINNLATSTNAFIDMSVEEEKHKFLNMPLEEKRNHYQINATTTDQIMSWRDYWHKNKANISKTKMENIERVDEDLASKVSMWQGDITSLEIDAIVNAANSSLMGGGGVDGAIHRAAGPSLKKECASLGGCQVGDAKITGGYHLPARCELLRGRMTKDGRLWSNQIYRLNDDVIHTVGPQGEQPEKLRACYENSLALAINNDLRTIAFPCISTGIYGYPQKPAAKIALTTVKKCLQDNKDKIDRVIFCLFLKSDKDIYEDLLQKYFALE